MGGRFGRLLYRWVNVSLRVLMPQAYADRGKLTPDIHAHYLERFPGRWSRGTVLWPLARAILGSSQYYHELWQKHEKLQERLILILWGMQDPVFQPDLLDQWRKALPSAPVVELPHVGHWLHEEEPHRGLNEMRNFLSQHPSGGER